MHTRQPLNIDSLLFSDVFTEYFEFGFRYATEVDVDFVRKSVRAIGRCAIKVEVICWSIWKRLQI